MKLDINKVINERNESNVRKMEYTAQNIITEILSIDEEITRFNVRKEELRTELRKLEVVEHTPESILGSVPLVSVY